MTLLNSDPSGTTEYKIIRSTTGAFKNPAKFRAVLEEEARAGWELLEKLDDARVRLRRSVSWRQKDGELSQDPNEADSLMDELLASNPRFQELVAKSKASPRRPFLAGRET